MSSVNSVAHTKYITRLHKGHLYCAMTEICIQSDKLIRKCIYLQTRNCNSVRHALFNTCDINQGSIILHVPDFVNVYAKFNFQEEKKKK